MKLSLRDFFWLLLVVGLACAWLIDRGRSAEHRRGLELELMDAKFAVEVLQNDLRNEKSGKGSRVVP